MFDVRQGACYAAYSIISDPTSGLSIPTSTSEPYTAQRSTAKRQEAWHADRLDSAQAGVRSSARDAKYADVTKRAVRAMSLAKTVRGYHAAKKTVVPAATATAAPP